jgi:hypothetical protein
VVFQIAKFELIPLKSACIAMISIMKVDKETLRKLTNNTWYKHLGYLHG